MTDQPDAWADYLAAAQRLDAVRRSLAAASADRERALALAAEELAGARARLAPQRARLRELGVPDDRLAPGPAEVAEAARTVGPGPAEAVAALRRARSTADAADAAVLGDGPRAAAGPTGPWLRNLAVYGPFALAVLVIEVALYLAADTSSPRLYAAACGLAMPALAFGLGWVVVGMAFPAGPRGRVQRTAAVGAVVCFAPVVLTCVGAGALALLR